MAPFQTKRFLLDSVSSWFEISTSVASAKLICGWYMTTESLAMTLVRVMALPPMALQNKGIAKRWSVHERPRLKDSVAEPTISSI